MQCYICQPVRNVICITTVADITFFFKCYFCPADSRYCCYIYISCSIFLHSKYKFSNHCQCHVKSTFNNILFSHTFSIYLLSAKNLLILINFSSFRTIIVDLKTCNWPENWILRRQLLGLVIHILMLSIIQQILKTRFGEWLGQFATRSVLTQETDYWRILENTNFWWKVLYQPTLSFPRFKTSKLSTIICNLIHPIKLGYANEDKKVRKENYINLVIYSTYLLLMFFEILYFMILLTSWCL